VERVELKVTLGALAAVVVLAGCAGGAPHKSRSSATPTCDDIAAGNATYMDADKAQALCEAERALQRQERRRGSVSPAAPSRPRRAAKKKPSPSGTAKQFREARLTCGAFPLSKIAADFGLSRGSSAETVAKRYARAYFPGWRYAAALDGCRVGIQDRARRP
jgi:hypothetical protein